MSDNQITIQLIGNEKDNQDVRLGVFLDRLKALENALEQLAENLAENDEETVYFRVIDLRHNSPATLTLECESTFGNTQLIQQFTSTFFQGINSIQKDAVAPQSFDPKVLKFLKEVSAPSRMGLTDIIVLGERHEPISLYKHFYQQVVKIIGSSYVERSSIDGIIEKVNVRDKSNSFFYLYPRFNKPSIKCVFDEEVILQQVRDNLGKFVNVRGIFNYRAGENQPYLISVLSIESNESNEPVNKPLSFSSLRGTAPEILSNIRSEDFIKDTRSGWTNLNEQ